MKGEIISPTPYRNPSVGYISTSSHNTRYLQRRSIVLNK
jgi:hypothetical protein